MTVKIINKSNHTLPEYKTKGSAGLDLKANLEEPITVFAGKRAVIPSGLFLEIPEGYEAQIRPRSGLSLNEGLVAILGTIDSDYRGEVGIIIHNTSGFDRIIGNGDRIAQMVFSKVEQVEWAPVADLSDTERGDKGFGSTGL